MAIHLKCNSEQILFYAFLLYLARNNNNADQSMSCRLHVAAKNLPIKLELVKVRATSAPVDKFNLKKEEMIKEFCCLFFIFAVLDASEANVKSLKNLYK